MSEGTTTGAGRAVARRVGAVALLLALALTAAMLRGTVVSSEGLAGVTVADGQRAELEFHGPGLALYVVETGHDDTVLALGVAQRGLLPVTLRRVVPPDEGGLDECRLALTDVRAARISDEGGWSVEEAEPLGDGLTLGRGEEASVWITADTAPADGCQGVTGSRTSIEVDVAVLGVTRRVEVPLGYTVAWAPDPAELVELYYRDPTGVASDTRGTTEPADPGDDTATDDTATDDTEDADAEDADAEDAEAPGGAGADGGR